MAQLQLALEEGFQDDLVEVRIDGREEVFDHVSSSPLTGLAASRIVDVPADATSVEIAVPTKQQFETISLPSPFPLHLGVSIVEGRLHHRFRDQLIGYM